MNVFDPWYVERLFLRPSSDDALFEKWTGFLPARTEDLPYTAQAHCIRHMRAALALTKAKTILEIGFNLGHSAAIWLGLGAKHVTSVETSMHPTILDAADRMKKKHGDNVTLGWGDRTVLAADLRSVDLIFIDGAHDQASVAADIALGRAVTAKWFLFDDFNPHWGPGVAPAIEASGLVPVALFGNMMLATEAEGWAA